MFASSVQNSLAHSAIKDDATGLCTAENEKYEASLPSMASLLDRDACRP
jgi:hypothetical protein